MTFRPNLIVAAATLLLAACGSPDEAKGAAGGVIASLADNVVEEVRQEMETKNLPVGSGSGHDLPKAEVTPEGVLVIDGVAVAMDQKQRDVALAYREAVIRVAEDGARVGLMGAQVGKDAAVAALAGVFSGADEAEVEAKVRASTAGIEAEAKKLCDTLPSLLAQQQALAEAVPAFAPYADMTQDDVDDCMRDVDIQ